MDPMQDWLRSETRRQFLGHGVNAVGWAANPAGWAEAMADANASSIQRDTTAARSAAEKEKSMEFIERSGRTDVGSGDSGVIGGQRRYRRAHRFATLPCRRPAARGEL